MFSVNNYAQSINDYQYYSDVNILSGNNLNSGNPILIILDTTDSVKFPFKDCLAVSFNEQLIGREIENFSSNETRLKFNLVNSISSNSLNQEYKLLTGCNFVLPENNSFTENWENISNDSSNSASFGWPVNASASNGSVSISNDYSVASGSANADSSLNNSLKKEWH